MFSYLWYFLIVNNEGNWGLLYRKTVEKQKPLIAMKMNEEGETAVKALKC